jgi:hypothetical protein
MPQFLVIGILLVTALLVPWSIKRHGAKRRQKKHTADLQQENAALRKAVADMAMEKHHSHDHARGQSRR